MKTETGLEIRILGPLTIARNGANVPLPRSRKVRVLLAYLALARAPTSRSRLCDLLWDVPNDPRGELRWCLSKLRSVLDDDVQKRVTTSESGVGLDLSDCLVDVHEVDRIAKRGVEPLTALAEEDLTALAETFRGHFLEGIQIDGSTELSGWLAAERHRYRTIHVAVLAELTKRAHERPPPVTARIAADPERTPRRRASVAVMPFVGRNDSAAADGLTEDVITHLAKLRVLFVIARGTVYALRGRGLDALEAGRLLGVDYVVSGRVRDHGDRVCVVVELAEAERARIVWTDELTERTDQTFAVLGTIVDRIVASVAEEIEMAECNRAILRPPSSLDAWEAYHRGLWHMYKFNGLDNRQAAGFFQNAIDLDPTFSRAYAGLSFTHFQNAFLDLGSERVTEIDLACDTAERSVAADPRDPAAHWAMGRALWLKGDEPDSFAELRQSIELSPNFALGHYTLGFVHSQTGDPRTAIDATDHSRRLSPFDPLQFAMLASRALAHIRLGELDEAAEWAVKATGRPNAHVHILAIAVQSLVLAKRRDDAKKFVGLIRKRAPTYTVEDFLRAFRFDADTTRLLRQAAKQIGFDSRRS